MDIKIIDSFVYIIPESEANIIEFIFLYGFKSAETFYYRFKNKLAYLGYTLNIPNKVSYDINKHKHRYINFYWKNDCGEHFNMNIASPGYINFKFIKENPDQVFIEEHTNYLQYDWSKEVMNYFKLFCTEKSN